MDTIVKLAFNLSIIIVLMFTYLIFHRMNDKRRPAWTVFLYFCIGVIASLLLSVNVNSEVRFDLRQVPLIVGTLYLGTVPGILLLLLVMVIRGFFGINDGFWICLVVFGAQTILCIYLHRWFIQQRNARKIETGILISILSSIALIILTYFNDYLFHWVDWMVYSVACAFGVGCMILIEETEKIHTLFKEKAKETEKIESVSQMSASISHEVRNPLTTVKGFLQLLRDPEFGQDKREEFINISLHELERAERIINDYLSFAKPASKKIEEISLISEISHVISVLQPLANMNSVVIKMNFEEDGIIFGDKNQLHQCFINLLKNSIESMQNGGELTVYQYGNGNGKEAIVQITDTGSGMSNEQLLQLGKPYFSTKGVNGTGLGIMVSFSVVKAFNGHIQVESELGMGTTFSITFPVIRQLEKERSYIKTI